MGKTIQVVKPLIDIRKPKTALAWLLVGIASTGLWWTMSYVIAALHEQTTKMFGDTWIPITLLFVMIVGLYTVAAILLKKGGK